MSVDMDKVFAKAGDCALQELIAAQIENDRHETGLIEKHALAVETLRPIQDMAARLARLPFMDNKGFEISPIPGYLSCSKEEPGFTFTRCTRSFEPLKRPLYKRVRDFALHLTGRRAPVDMMAKISRDPDTIIVRAVVKGGEPPRLNLMRFLPFECSGYHGYDLQDDILEPEAALQKLLGHAAAFAPETIAQMAPRRIEHIAVPRLLTARQIASTVQIAADFTNAAQWMADEAARLDLPDIDLKDLLRPAEIIGHLLRTTDDVPRPAISGLVFHLKMTGNGFRQITDRAALAAALHDGKVETVMTPETLHSLTQSFRTTVEALNKIAAAGIHAGIEDALTSLDVLNEQRQALRL